MLTSVHIALLERSLTGQCLHDSARTSECGEYQYVGAPPHRCLSGFDSRSGLTTSEQDGVDDWVSTAPGTTARSCGATYRLRLRSRHQLGRPLTAPNVNGDVARPFIRAHAPRAGFLWMEVSMRSDYRSQMLGTLPMMSATDLDLRRPPIIDQLASHRM